MRFITALDWGGGYSWSVWIRLHVYLCKTYGRMRQSNDDCSATTVLNGCGHCPPFPPNQFFRTLRSVNTGYRANLVMMQIQCIHEVAIDN